MTDHIQDEGQWKGYGERVCSTCGGNGVIHKPSDTEEMACQVLPCPDCGGTGKEHADCPDDN